MRQPPPSSSWRIQVIRCVLLVAITSAGAGAAELALELRALIQDDANLAAPGRAKPMTSAQTVALQVSWDNDNYRSLIVIEPGDGLRQPAWVATFSKEDGLLDVAYPATAFHDANGRLHIDARHMRLSGELGENWIPDSFAIGLSDGSVSAIDDLDRTNTGHLEERIDQTESAKRYSTLLGVARACVLSRM